jgi:hypothetical protein
VPETSPRDDARSGAGRRERWVTFAVVVAGLVLMPLWVLLLRSAVQRWDSSTWFTASVEVATAASALCVCVALALYPLRGLKVVHALTGLLLLPLTILATLGRYYTFVAAPFLAFSFLLAIPSLVWAILRRAGLIASSWDAASLYAMLSFSTVAFTIWGQRMTRFVIQDWLRRREDFSRLFLLMRPSLVRVYTYAILAIGYVLANVENLTGLELVPVDLWPAQKQILMEVLLTYVALDSLLVAWRDHRQGTGPYT